MGRGGSSSGGRKSVGNFLDKAAGARERFVEVVERAGGDEERTLDLDIVDVI